MKKTAIDFKQQATLLRAIANETRLKIIDVLSNGEMDVGTIAHRIGVEQSTVSKHLAILRAVWVVDNERHGNEGYYRLRPLHDGLLMCTRYNKQREI